MSGSSARGLWSGCHLTWHISWLEMLTMFRALKHFLPDLRGHHVLVRKHRQHIGGLLLQPPGRSAFAPLVQAGAPDHFVVPGQTPLAESSSYSLASQYGSRHPVETGAEAQGMDASPRGGKAEMESFLKGTLYDWGDIAMSPLVLSFLQLLWDWMLWRRLGRVFVCMLFPRSLCSREFWRECAGTRSVYYCPIGTVLEFLQASFSLKFTWWPLRPTTCLSVVSQWVDT